MTGYARGPYGLWEKMSDMICANYQVLLVMSRFGIRLGVGDKTVEQVCREHGVDAGTFLAVVNLTLGGAATTEISLAELLKYLQNSHDYFLAYRLPRIRTRLAEAIGRDGSKLTRSIMRFFDQYADEVGKHMAYEEREVFPYVRALVEGQGRAGYDIEVFSRKHDPVEMRLSEFKDVLIRFYASGDANEINAVMFDIFNCERDLASHNAVEDMLFVPAVRRLLEQSENDRS